MPWRPRSDVAQVVAKAILAARAGRHVRGSRDQQHERVRNAVRVERNVIKIGT